MSARAPRAAFDAETIRGLVRGKRFLAADRAALDIGEIATWDSYLLREHRLLVPIDVQALYVQPGNLEKMVRLPMLLAGPEGQVAATADAGMPEPFAEGEPRPAGVHLHWAMPDALLRGRFEQRADATANRLALPVLPDRWVVLRILLPRGATDVVVTGWVLEADRALATPLAAWREGKPPLAPPLSPTPAGATVAKDRLTGTVGGAVSWSAVYDAVLNRFAFHDPLADVDTAAPQGVDEDCASYLVAGWWSDPAHDPLDQARGKDSLHELLDRLRWRLLHEWGDANWAQEQQKAQFDLRKALGLTTAERWSSRRPIPSGGKTRAAARATATYTPIAATFMEQPTLASSSFFATEAAKRYIAAPWQLRSSLLHGAIHGVPVKGDPPVDRRPAPDALSVAIGHHDDDLLAAFAAPAQASAEQRRATERLLAAFTTQKVNRMSSPDGLVELEEHEHAIAFSSLPGGSAGTDRYLQRVQTGGVGGLALGKKSKLAANAIGVLARQPLASPERHARPAAPDSSRAAGGTMGSQMLFATNGKPSFIKASEMAINDLAHSRVGDVLAPTEARVVDRPAVRFTFANEPMVAIRGASRSLRHGGDGRGSADGKLTCRWPTHVIGEIPGLIAMDRFVRTLGSGATPSEVLTLARETVLHDPYHDGWIARAITQPGQDRRAILSRLRAESALRYGYDGTYDGATQAFHPDLAKTPAARRRQAAAPLEPGVRQTQLRLADELRRFSVYKGADPDLVGVTTWAQPWIPLWLEWEVKIDGLDPPTLAAWQLGSIDLESDRAGIEGDTAVLRGRALLTAGAAATLHDAIADWLKAEDALDTVSAGLVDEQTEDKLRILDEAVRHLDVVTAALDGVRGQLLGFDMTDGLRRPGNGGAVDHPAPQRAPRALLAGAVSLTRARLLDAFGRTLDVPLASVATPTRTTQAGQPGLLAMPPRLLRPARWLFRLVDAATAVGTEGTEARIDQIEPSLQVNPVAGFVMPDHLDESLEVFGVDGSPLGELLHEVVSGGVTWEIAAGRPGPADAGPLYGLTPAQQVLGRFAAGLVDADAHARGGAPLPADDPTRESALSALLRAIDTTLWSVDTFAALGSEHVAGLVGRPAAVVRAQLRLEFKPANDVDLSDPQRAAEWAAAERDASRYAFPVRIGEVTRSDDGVLGFFVDDDFSRFRLVDKTIAGAATESGRSRGQLGLYAKASGMPTAKPIEHDYIAGRDSDDTLLLHLGQTVTLTLLMHPAGKASLTSGLLPRKALALARDWVGPGLAAIAPSLRTGPVLVETDLDTERQVRLPKVSVFGKDQNFLWRDTPATWRTDAILAATQTALLPDTPAEFREGWIRVAPDKPETAKVGGGGKP
jgi:hypothetical protein